MEKNIKKTVVLLVLLAIGFMIGVALGMQWFF